MIEFLVVISNSVTKPTRDPTERVPPENNAATTPPTSANGRFARTSSVLRILRKAIDNNSTMPTVATMEYERISRCA